MFEQFLAAPRVMVLENDGRRELSGLWRLPVMPEGTVKPAFAEYNKGRGWCSRMGRRMRRAWGSLWWG